MATRNDVREIALALPDVQEDLPNFAFSVPAGAKRKGFAWVWLERVHPKRPRVPNPEVLAVRVANLDTKEVLLMADPVALFDEPHYSGYPAVLVRIAKIRKANLRRLLIDAWATLAPKSLVDAHRLASQPGRRVLSPPTEGLTKRARGARSIR
jgi:hypothetical protein